MGVHVRIGQCGRIVADHRFGRHRVCLNFFQLGGGPSVRVHSRHGELRRVTSQRRSSALLRRRPRIFNRNPPVSLDASGQDLARPFRASASGIPRVCWVTMADFSEPSAALGCGQDLGSLARPQVPLALHVALFPGQPHPFNHAPQPTSIPTLTDPSSWRTMLRRVLKRSSSIPLWAMHAGTIGLAGTTLKNLDPGEALHAKAGPASPGQLPRTGLPPKGDLALRGGLVTRCAPARFLGPVLRRSGSEHSPQRHDDAPPPTSLWRIPGVPIAVHSGALARPSLGFGEFVGLVFDPRHNPPPSPHPLLPGACAVGPTRPRSSCQTREDEPPGGGTASGPRGTGRFGGGTFGGWDRSGPVPLESLHGRDLVPWVPRSTGAAGRMAKSLAIGDAQLEPLASRPRVERPWAVGRRLSPTSNEGGFGQRIAEPSFPTVVPMVLYDHALD